MHNVESSEVNLAWFLGILKDESVISSPPVGRAVKWHYKVTITELRIEFTISLKDSL